MEARNAYYAERAAAEAAEREAAAAKEAKARAEFQRRVAKRADELEREERAADERDRQILAAQRAEGRSGAGARSVRPRKRKSDASSWQRRTRSHAGKPPRPDASGSGRGSDGFWRKEILTPAVRYPSPEGER